MPHLTNMQWLLIGLAVAAWIIPAIRMARLAPHYGRSSRRWFFITLFGSALPAAIVFSLDHRNTLSARDLRAHRASDVDADDPAPDAADEASATPAPRCPHCGETLAPDDATGRPTCPRCHLARPEDRLA